MIEILDEEELCAVSGGSGNSGSAEKGFYFTLRGGETESGIAGSLRLNHGRMAGDQVREIAAMLMDHLKTDGAGQYYITVGAGRITVEFEG